MKTIGGAPASRKRASSARRRGRLADRGSRTRSVARSRASRAAGRRGRSSRARGRARASGALRTGGRAPAEAQLGAQAPHAIARRADRPFTSRKYAGVERPRQAAQERERRRSDEDRRVVDGEEEERHEDDRRPRDPVDLGHRARRDRGVVSHEERGASSRGSRVLEALAEDGEEVVLRSLEAADHALAGVGVALEVHVVRRRRESPAREPRPWRGSWRSSRARRRDRGAAAPARRRGTGAGPRASRTRRRRSSSPLGQPSARFSRSSSTASAAEPAPVSVAMCARIAAAFSRTAESCRSASSSRASRSPPT